MFVDDADEVPVDATPFDMRGVELSHHGGDCSVETFLRRYELADERYDAPEAPGFDVLLRGLSMVRDDEELLALSAQLLDGLYEYPQACAAVRAGAVVSGSARAEPAGLAVRPPRTIRGLFLYFDERLRALGARVERVERVAEPG